MKKSHIDIPLRNQGVVEYAIACNDSYGLWADRGLGRAGARPGAPHPILRIILFP